VDNSPGHVILHQTAAHKDLFSTIGEVREGDDRGLVNDTLDDLDLIYRNGLLVPQVVVEGLRCCLCNETCLVLSASRTVRGGC